MKQSEIAYMRRVNWYNSIIDKISKLPMRLDPSKRIKSINKVLTEAIEKLEKTVHPNYTIDRATQTRLTEISEQMAEKDSESLKRKGEGESRRNFIKFFSLQLNKSGGQIVLLHVKPDELKQGALVFYTDDAGTEKVNKMLKIPFFF